jgi:hypothetical protein
MQWGRKPRRRGTWYVTEHMVRAMRAYGWTIIVGAVGQPILYLLGSPWAWRPSSACRSSITARR